MNYIKISRIREKYFTFHVYVFYNINMDISDKKTENDNYTDKKTTELIAILSEEWLEIVADWLAKSSLYKKNDNLSESEQNKE